MKCVVGHPDYVHGETGVAAPHAPVFFSPSKWNLFFKKSRRYTDTTVYPLLQPLQCWIQICPPGGIPAPPVGGGAGGTVEFCWRNCSSTPLISIKIQIYLVEHFDAQENGKWLLHVILITMISQNLSAITYIIILCC